jgi:hypothetical protein
LLDQPALKVRPVLWARKAQLVPPVRQGRAWLVLPAKRVLPVPPVSEAQPAQQVRQELLKSGALE